MNILAFAGSNSINSLNKKLVIFATTYFAGNTIEVLDLNDYEMPIYSIDRQINTGIPQLAIDFSEKIKQADLILISFAEHNGAYSVAFKNILDWMSRIPKQEVWANKPMFLLSTSPGARGGASVMEIAKNRIPRNGGRVLETFSLPNFNDNFSSEKGIINPTYLKELEEKIDIVKNTVNL